MPINFAAAFGRAANAIPGQRSVINDRHHDLFKKNIKGTVLIFPACIGSTFTGMVLMQIMYKKEAPVAMVIHAADPLIVAGSILADVWFKCGIPVVEYDRQDMFNMVHTGDIIEVNGDTGKIKICS
jgi:predicted aconitase with swiveling domain